MDFKSILGITIPKEFSNALKLERGQYVEVFFRDKKTLIIKKHEVEPKQITTAD